MSSYTCSKCTAKNCKLWRDFMRPDPLLCATCAFVAQNKKVQCVDRYGYVTTGDWDRTDQIGWMVPAVPFDDGCMVMWSYTAVPENRITWWRALPTYEEK